MSSKVIRLTLVRHGQTHENKLKIIQGQANTQLTELGRDMARQLHDYWNKTGTKFDKVYSSDLDRAYETCQLVCGDKYEIVKNQLLRERSFGVLQGSPLEKLKSEAYKAGHDESNFTQFRPDGGETMDEVQERVRKFCADELFPNAAQSCRVLVVTHGGVVREIMKLFKKSGCPLTNSAMIITPNTSMNEFEIHLTSDNVVEKIVVLQLHQVPHLRGDAQNEALHEEQLNDGSTKKKEEVRYAI